MKFNIDEQAAGVGQGVKASTTLAGLAAQVGQAPHDNQEVGGSWGVEADVENWNPEVEAAGAVHSWRKDPGDRAVHGLEVGVEVVGWGSDVVE